MITFRYAFLAGLLLALGVGLWLWQLWTPPRQVQLHSEHLLAALEDKDWESAAEFLDESYLDQWKQDRVFVVERLRQVLTFARNLKLKAASPIVLASDAEGVWKSRVAIEADSNEIADLIKSRINVLEEPFELHWRRNSRKPWDWKLVRVTNSALEIPEGF